MSHAQQVCPFCSWERLVRLPDGLEWGLAESVGRHVARSLQWEWQAHMMREHSPEMVNAHEVLTLAGFDKWVAQETYPPVLQETPPSEGEGQTVRANLPTITPEQAKQLAEAVEHTMVGVADSIQRFAERAVPAIHAAQETLVKSLRDLVEQRPAFGCACNGGQGDHQPGGDGCMFRPIPAGQVDLTLPFWRNPYAAVPLADPNLTDGSTPPPRRPVHVQRDLADGVPGDRPYGTVSSEVCACCLRVQGEPHQFPNCDLAEES